ncbi:hypothetical protein PSPO01_00767 [Paraphaeosphaeria sporulosa]
MGEGRVKRRQEPPAGGGTEFCCGGIPLCGGNPALGGPFPTLIARPAPGPGRGPDMAQVSLLFHDAPHSRIHLEADSVAWNMERV